MTIIVNTDRPIFRDPSPEELIDQPVAAGDYFGTTSSKGGFVWHFDGTTAVRVGIPEPDHRSKVALQTGESLRDALGRMPMFGDDSFVIHQMTLPPGAYYPRIARPIDQHPLDALGYSPGVRTDSHEMISSLSQVRSLVAMLENIFQTVHPATANMSCFGSGIRNLIMLACTECETQWRAVLNANGYKADVKNSRLTTDDYVKLRPAMKLDEYRLGFNHYPWLESVAPFKGWNASCPTRSIGWYRDYNAVKHDREVSFNRASLGNAIKSVAATWVMIAAQYGHIGIREFDDLWRYFRLDHVPRWRFSELYSMAHHGPHQKPVNYPF